MSFVDNFLKFIKNCLLHKFISSQDTVAIFRCQSWEANKLSRNQSEFVSKNSICRKLVNAHNFNSEQSTVKQALEIHFLINLMKKTFDLLKKGIIHQNWRVFM